MDISNIRKKILELAIQGKLSSTNIESKEDVNIILNLIKEEKAKRSHTVRQGKMIQELFSPPFEIPAHWAWVRLCDITEFIVDCPHTTAKNEGSGYALIRTPNVGEGELILEGVHRVSYKTYLSRNKRATPEEGDVIYAREAPAGNAAIIGHNEKVCLGQRVVLLRPFKSIYNPKYIAYALIAPSSKDRLISKASGSTGEHVNLESIRPFFIPFPPKNEQDIIVGLIDKCFQLLKNIEDANLEIKLFSNMIHQNSLHSLFQGNFGTNNPSEPDASDIILKHNPNASISRNSLLPNNWIICKLDDIVDYEQPTKYIVSTTNYSDDFDTPVLTAGKSFILGYTDETEGIYDKLPVIIFDDFTTDSRLVDFPFKVKSSALKILTVSNGINPEYVAAFMSITRLLGDSHKRMWISEYSKIEIPIPPSEEQNRIVAKIKKIQDLINNIKSNC